MTRLSSIPYFGPFAPQARLLDPAERRDLVRDQARVYAHHGGLDGFGDTPDAPDWDQFHTPKNLSSALAVEAAELLEHFQWLQHGRPDELGEAKLREVKREMADVLVYLVRLADKLDVDLMAAVQEKMVLNRAKYPADLVRGDARKYDEYKRTQD